MKKDVTTLAKARISLPQAKETKQSTQTKQSQQKPLPKAKEAKEPKQTQKISSSKLLPKPKPVKDNTTTPPIKVVFLGDGNCGKTSALISYTTDVFNPDYTPTVFDSYESVVKKGEHIVKLQLWDTAGQDEYKKLRALSYPKTDVFLICFSMVEKKSFTNAISKWYNEVKENCPRAQIIFVGTKIDLMVDFIAINKTQNLLDENKVEKKVTSMGHKLVLCSSLTQKGLNKVFDTAIDIMITKRQEEEQIYKKASEIDCQLI